MDERSAELRQAIERSRGGRTRWRCPQGLRLEVLELVGCRREAGTPLAEVAADLGLSESSISRWEAANRAGVGDGGRLREVRVVERGPGSTGLCLVTPRGFRVEGLDAESALRLLREL